MTGSDDKASTAGVETAEPRSAAGEQTTGEHVAVAPDGTPVVRERRRRRDHIDWPLVGTLALGLAGGLLLANLVGGLLSRLSTLLVVLIVSLFLSFAMEPAVQWLAQRGVRRGIGTFLVFIAAGLLLIGFLAAMAQLIIDQVAALIDG
ncbi:MAG: AI-2E family transporter, partial [Nitriliruptorales bacterium]|nr:AI-2E family transporter [Nitriliruptorales bacterium]